MNENAIYKLAELWKQQRDEAREENDWIMLENQWPEHRQMVLAYCRDPSDSDLDSVGFYCVVVAPLKYNEEGRKKHGSDMFFVDFNGIGPNHMGHDVIAWMPLPEPPE